MKVIVSLSGGEVTDLVAPDDIEVEVRQYHVDFADPEQMQDDPAGGRYAVIGSSRPNGADTVRLVANRLREEAIKAYWEPTRTEVDHNGPPMDTTDYEGRALAFMIEDLDGYQLRVTVEDVTPDEEWRN